MKKNTFDSSAVVLGWPFAADFVSAFRPGRSAETRSTSRTLSRIGREADLLFKAVDVLGVVPNQPASITQATDKMVCSCRSGTLSVPTHLGNILVEERSSFRIKEHRGMEKTTATLGISAIV